MAMHLIKMAVGVEDLDHLRELRRRRRAGEGEGPVRIRTRHRPARGTELLDGGSIFWVIKGVVRVRQRVLGLAAASDEEGRGCCILELDHALVETEPVPHRPFQGWRYLAPAAAPPDRASAGSGDALPAGLVRELRSLGLL